METNEQPLSAESSAVHTHLRMMQDVISRMASNSASCKTWCVTLVAAVLVLIVRAWGESLKPEYALIALVPTIAFLVLDAYYLSLERRFRNAYNDFVDKLHKGELQGDELYAIRPLGSVIATFLNCLLRSFSVLPFYLILIALIVIAWLLVMD